MKKLISLFAGIGGFDLGFERAGFRVSVQCEIDQHCQTLLADKFPGVPIHGDVRTFNIGDYECPDVVTFGSPCQDLSVAGSRGGLSAKRSGLFFYATRVIQRFVRRGLQFAVWENVPGAFSSNGGRDFAAVLAALADAGALDIAWTVLDAQWRGLAQRRKRVFLVADFRGERAGEILSLSEGLRWDTPPRRETGQGVAPTVAGCSNGGGANGPGRTVDDRESLQVANPVAGHHSRQDLDNDTWVMAHGQGNAEIRRDGEPSLTCNHEAPILAHAVSAGRDGYNDGSDQTYVPVAFSSKDHGADATNDLSPTLRSGNFDTSHIGGGCSPAIAFTERTRADGRNFECQEDIAYALTNPGSGGRTHSRQIAERSGVRRLTPLECERLQGFPDGWTDGGFSDSVRYRMLGNAVPPPITEWIARQIADQICEITVNQQPQ